MGGKKKAAGGKKGGDDDEDNPSDINKALQAAVDSLKMRVCMEQERKDKSYTVEKNIRDNEKALREELMEQKAETKKCVEEMTETYKRMEQTMQKDIDDLITVVDGQESQIKTLNEQISNLKDKKEKDQEYYDE